MNAKKSTAFSRARRAGLTAVIAATMLGGGAAVAAEPPAAQSAASDSPLAATTESAPTASPEADIDGEPCEPVPAPVGDASETRDATADEQSEDATETEAPTPSEDEPEAEVPVTSEPATKTPAKNEDSLASNTLATSEDAPAAKTSSQAPRAGAYELGGATVTGTPEVGQTLHGSSIYDPDQDFYPGVETHWLRDGEVIPGSTGTSTYTVTSADEGHTIAFQITDGVASSTSDGVVVAKGAPVIETNESTAWITGQLSSGATLTGNFIEDDFYPGSVTYQWSADGVPIPGETGRTFWANDFYRGQTITFHVSDGGTQATSPGVVFGWVTGVQGEVHIAGERIVGSTLSVDVPDIDDYYPGVEYTYTWSVDSEAVGTGATYGVQPEDAGKSVSVTVVPTYPADGTIEPAMHDTVQIAAADVVDPTDPTDPVTPVDPTDPTNPVTPVDPTDPTNPVTPVDPTDPVTPVSPVDNPVTPVSPVDNPITTVTGGKADLTDPTNIAPLADGARLAETGSDGSQAITLGAAAALLAGAGSGLLVARRRAPQANERG